MKFKKMYIIIQNDEITEEDITKIYLNSLANVNTHGKYWYSIDKKIIDEKYIWFNVSYNNSKLYKENVYNGDREKDEKNPRNRGQVELNRQLFICFDIVNKELYISDIERVGFVRYYFGLIVRKTVILKNYYTSIDDFKKKIKKIHKMKFVHSYNMFNTCDQTIFSKTSNMYGLDSPNRISTQFNLNIVEHNINDFFNQLSSYKSMLDDGSADEIIFVGKDDNDVECVFDFRSLISSIEILVSKDENDLFDEKDVELKFMEELLKNVQRR